MSNSKETFCAALYKEVEQLREQIAAEREAVEQYKIAFEAANDTCKQLREQLAAEREEKEMFQRSQEAWIADYRKSQEQLAAAMEAVNFFASVIKSGEPWTSTCDAALAKINQ